MKLAVYQFAPKLGDVPGNLDAILHQVADVDADLIVFPECALSGYGFETAEDAVRAAEPVPGPSTELIARACRVLRGLESVPRERAFDGRSPYRT